jgi:polar amino acid transport system ATP-binding protein
MLKVSNISKSFKDNKVLNSISFNAEPGSVTIFLGTSGTGKSTILRLLNNLETTDSGTILLNNKPLQQKDIGMVFQSFNLFAHLTVEENITLPLIHVFKKTKTEAQKIARELLKQYQLEELAQSYPGSLSGGQQQRVALARTLATNPKIVCLDEPTSALDPILTTTVAKIITKLAQKKLTIIIATHDTDLIKQLSCTIHLMNKGDILETATTKELIANPDKHPKLKRFLNL